MAWKSRPSPVSQHLLHHSHYRNTATAAENCRGNSSEPKRIWADPGHLPSDVLEYVQAAIGNARAGTWFSEHGWEPVITRSL